MKRSFLKYLPLLALALLSHGCKKNEPAAAADAGAAAKPAAIKIGFLVKQPEEPWFQFEWKGADKAGAALGFEVMKLGVTDG